MDTLLSIKDLIPILAAFIGFATFYYTFFVYRNPSAGGKYILSLLDQLSRLLPPFFTIYIALREEEKKDPIEERAKKLTNSLNESVQLVQELQDEIQKRQKAVEELSEEIKAKEALRQLTAAEEVAITRELKRISNSQSRKNVLQSLGTGFIWFIAGAIVTIVFS